MKHTASWRWTHIMVLILIQHRIRSIHTTEMQNTLGSIMQDLFAALVPGCNLSRKAFFEPHDGFAPFIMGSVDKWVPETVPHGAVWRLQYYLANQLSSIGIKIEVQSFSHHHPHYLSVSDCISENVQCEIFRIIICCSTAIAVSV